MKNIRFHRRTDGGDPHRKRIGCRERKWPRSTGSAIRRPTTAQALCRHEAGGCEAVAAAGAREQPAQEAGDSTSSMMQPPTLIQGAEMAATYSTNGRPSRCSM